MNHVKVRELISIEELHNKLPLACDAAKNILRHRQEIKNILAGKDSRLILIVGPCSAWPSQAVIEYAKRLAKLNAAVSKHLKIVMRVYPHKPRTTIGWHGALLQPDIFAEVDINKGLYYSRAMMLDVIKLGLPIAAEVLSINLHDYLTDLLSWVAIGARSSENQEHRLFASSINIPTGLKNPTHGSLAVAVNSILTAQHQHSTIYDNHQVTTNGNDYAHLVLRGGNNQSNYSISHLEKVKHLLKKNNITNPAVLIDVNHDNSIINSVRNYKSQPKTVIKLLNEFNTKPQLKNIVKGFMIESFIQDGNQDISSKNLNLEGLSLTDPCIGWDTTEKLILDIAKILGSTDPRL